MGNIDTRACSKLSGPHGFCDLAVSLSQKHLPNHARCHTSPDLSSAHTLARMRACTYKRTQGCPAKTYTRRDTVFVIMQSVGMKKYFWILFPLLCDSDNGITTEYRHMVPILFLPRHIQHPTLERAESILFPFVMDNRTSTICIICLTGLSMCNIAMQLN